MDNLMIDMDNIQECQSTQVHDLLVENCCWHYPKDARGKRTGNTVCILVRDGRIFVGEAVLSPEDQFSKKVGREISKQRAENSYKSWCLKQIQKELK
jgi:hypothetical protein